MKMPFIAIMAESVRLEPTEVGCRVEYRQGIQGRRGFGPLMPAVGKRMGASIRTALANLKTRVEG